jgi:hypothetical protein
MGSSKSGTGPAKAGHYVVTRTGPAKAGHYVVTRTGPAKAGHYVVTRTGEETVVSGFSRTFF